jgi:hypothetical protein
VTQGADGDRATRAVPASDLEGVTFRVDEQQIRWEQVEAGELMEL